MVTESRAGDDALGVVVAPGTVAYVTTGGEAAPPPCPFACPGRLSDRTVVAGAGPIPDGADAVVQVEDTEQVPVGADGAMRVRILARAAEGQDIRNVVCKVCSLHGY